MFPLGFVPQRGGILNIPSKNEHSFVTRLVPPAKLLCACAIFCYIYWYLFRFWRSGWHTKKERKHGSFWLINI